MNQPEREEEFGGWTSSRCFTAKVFPKKSV
jgi:hypothetical protein